MQKSIAFYILHSKITAAVSLFNDMEDGIDSDRFLCKPSGLEFGRLVMLFLK